MIDSGPAVGSKGGAVSLERGTPVGLRAQLWLIDPREGVPREQKMLKGHLPRVIYRQVYWYRKIQLSPLGSEAGLDDAEGGEQGTKNISNRARFERRATRNSRQRADMCDARRAVTSGPRGRRGARAPWLVEKVNFPAKSST